MEQFRKVWYVVTPYDIDTAHALDVCLKPDENPFHNVRALMGKYVQSVGYREASMVAEACLGILISICNFCKIHAQLV